MNKFSKSLLFSLVLIFLVVGTVFAGSTLDYGQLTDLPDDGTINFYAWITDLETEDNVPSEIITEDSYNSSQGLDQGYIDTPDGPMWFLVVRNFKGADDETNPVGMLFGGLQENSGTTWSFDFEWTVNPSIKFWDVVGQKDTGTVACPTKYPVIIDPVTLSKTITFYGEANKVYQLYRSELGSGAGNGESNGRYQWLAEVLTDENGFGTYTDTTYSQDAPGTWYEILLFDPAEGFHGCHSELAGPTNVRVFDFTAAFNVPDKVVELNWETASEFDILGFNVLRSKSKVGGREQLNEDLILADNPGGSGSSYNFVDDSITMGSTYYYWIEVVETGGGRESVGPRDVRSGYLFYIPFVK